MPWTTENPRRRRPSPAPRQVKLPPRPAVGRGEGVGGWEKPPTPPATAPPTAPAPRDTTYVHVECDGFAYTLPAWASTIRPHQIEAVRDILDAYRDGAKVVFLDAPTGAGKTLIGELVRQQLNAKGVYVCSGLELQSQMAADFPRAAVIRGRSNYPVLNPGKRRRVSAADCQGVPCQFCEPISRCPYRVASEAATAADLAVLNTTYLLYKWNKAYPYRERPKPQLVVLDECDMLEGELLSFMELRLRYADLATLGIDPPSPRKHYTTLATWLRTEYLQATAKAISAIRVPDPLDPEDEWDSPEDATTFKKISRSIDMVRRTMNEIADGNWVRDDDRDAFVMKPITVDGYARGLVWNHAPRWLAMSATVISAEQMAADLGLEDGEWASVKVPMTFPVENRLIRVVGNADMSNKMDANDEAKLLDTLDLIRSHHADERMLVHAHSYKLTRLIVDGLRARGHRDVLTYDSAAGRTGAIGDYLATPGALIVAPSLDRGIDFPGDDCRVQVVAKVPYPYLGDKQVNARMRAEGGQTWYSVQTVRTLVQMTGRAVRSKDDHATTYILDANFGRIFRMNRTLFPEWWRDAVDRTFNLRQLGER